MPSQMSASLFRWFPMWPLPMMPWTSLYSPLAWPPSPDIWPWTPTPRHWTWDPTYHWHLWPTLETCSNLFISGPPQKCHLVVVNEAHTVCQASGTYPTGMLPFVFQSNFKMFRHFSFIKYCFFPFHINLDIIIGDLVVFLISLPAYEFHWNNLLNFLF